MPWNGSGVFNRIYSWVADKAAGLDISSTRMDTDTNDIASNGFGNCLTRDGQGQPTANLPMANFRHTSVANGVARSDYSALGQAQDGLLNWTIATGSADAIAATYTPSRGAPVDGALYGLRATAANATTTPTFAPDGQSARTITRLGGQALEKGDIPGALAEVLLRYNAANTRYELLNPVRIKMPTVQDFSSGSATYNPPAGCTAIRVRMIAGGGGGGGGGGTGTVAGSNGGVSSFGSWTAAFGGGGSNNNVANGGQGGGGGSSGVDGTGVRIIRLKGGGGQSGSNSNANYNSGWGGSGGVSPFGGGGQPQQPVGGGTGSGGAGGANGSNGAQGQGGGGGAGEYVEFWVVNPTSTSYTVGAGGAGGAAGTGSAGNPGDQGRINVEEFYF